MFVVDVVRKRKNRGSMILEMTLLIPIVLVCMYLYVYLFLGLVRVSKAYGQAAGQLYAKEGSVTKGRGIIHKNGEMSIAAFKEDDTYLNIQVTLRKEDSDVLKNLRRWQLAAGGI